MTTLAEALTDACDAAQGLKEALVLRGGRGGNTDMTGAILVYRGDTMVAVVSPEHVDRDLMLAGVRMAAIGMCPDLVAIVQETYHSELRKNPRTRKAWRPGEMQALAEQHNGLDRGWVAEALTVMACNRAGDISMRVLPYRVNGTAVRWLPDVLPPEQPGDEAPRFSGVVPDSIRASMEEPDIMQQVRANGMQEMIDELGFERAQAHADVAFARFLTDPPGKHGRYQVVLSAQEGTERFDVIHNRANGGEPL